MKRCPICSQSYPGDQRFCSVHGLPLVEELSGGSREAGELTGLVLDGRYRLAGVAGRGGMGVVYEAEHLRIGRRCAVKVLHHELHADTKMRMRLFREVQATSRVHHPNVVEILDFGDDPRAGAYLVMEYLAGRSLAEIIRTEGPLALPVVVRVTAQLATGLVACHASGLIHRDLKPSNVRVLPSGVVKVLDFGLVKPYEPDRPGEFLTITTGGMAFGTPWYMSPEQASFQPLDPRTDIYSLGVMLYEMAVGKPPFSGENPLELIDAHRHKPVPLPSSMNPGVVLPAALEMLILKALSKEPDQRFQTVSELLAALLRLARQEDISLTDLTISSQEPSALPTTEPNLMPSENLEWTLPLSLPDFAAADLDQALGPRFDELSARIAGVLRSVIPRYRNIDSERLASGARVSLETALEVCRSPSIELPVEMRRLADERSEQQFTPAEILGALWLELSMLRPILVELASDDPAQARKVGEQIDQRMLTFIVKLSEYYFSRYHSRLLELNERLSQQNDELGQLRNALTSKLDLASRQLVESEQLKARVFETINSGVLLIDRESHVIRIYNRAMERISGLPVSQAVGRTIDDVLPFVEGVPRMEFLEQVQMHGQVGLRKLWLRLKNGTQKAVYVSGQPFHDSAGQHVGTIFLVEDVTEREHIIESFSRYLSRDVVDNVLRRGKSLEPSGETREVVILAVNIRNFRRTSKDLPLAAVVELLTDYVRVVSEAVFHHGGTIETVVGDSLLVHFDHLRGTTRPAISAAIELLRRLEGINLGRVRRQMPAIQAGIGIHMGPVVVANVGGKRRMVHTMVGDAAAVAHALQEVASGGEILVSAEVAGALGEGVTLENGPRVSVEGQSLPVEALRVAFDPEPMIDPVE